MKFAIRCLSLDRGPERREWFEAEARRHNAKQPNAKRMIARMIASI
jgi:hypothetical protein